MYSLGWALSHFSLKDQSLNPIVMLNLRFQLNFDWVWFGLFKEVP